VRDGEGKTFRIESKSTDPALDDDRGMEEFKPVKGGLRLTEDDEEDLSDDKSLNISYLEDDSPSVE
jgi:hypothetical protein